MEKSKLAKMALSALVMASAMTVGAHAEGTNVLLASAACGGGSSAPSYSTQSYDQSPSAGCSAARPSRRGQYSSNNFRNDARQQQQQQPSYSYSQQPGYSQHQYSTDEHNDNSHWSNANNQTTSYAGSNGETIYEENWEDNAANQNQPNMNNTRSDNWNAPRR